MFDKDAIMYDASSFEVNGYVVLRDFWKDSELDALQEQLEELGRLVVGEDFSSVDR